MAPVHVLCGQPYIVSLSFKVAGLSNNLMIRTIIKILFER